jgi:hypothetical protein
MIEVWEILVYFILRSYDPSKLISQWKLLYFGCKFGHIINYQCNIPKWLKILENKHSTLKYKYKALMTTDITIHIIKTLLHSVIKLYAGVRIQLNGAEQGQSR